jgi:arylsulfatase
MPHLTNILWICSDQQRWDTLGCYGNRFVETPNLDRLSNEGVHFENAFCQSPICTPSRASFLTGRYPRTTRCRQNGQEIPEEEILITKILSDSGYNCELAGKFHLSPCNPSVCPEMERRINDGYETFHWSHHSGNGWETNAYHQWLKTRGKAYTERPHPESQHVTFGPNAEDHQTTWCAETAIQFMKNQAETGEPWLFSVNFFDPHHPFDAPEALLERYIPILNEIPLPEYRDGELDDKPPWQQREHKQAYGGYPFDQMSDKDHRLVRASYFAMCDLIDQQVGRMLDALEETGQRENTLVVYMSDHGEMLGDHGIYLKGAHFYEPAVHVPLIFSQPGRLMPQHISDLVELTDLAPTFLDAIGLPRQPGMQGKSIWERVVNGVPHSTTRHRKDIYSEYYNAMPADWSSWHPGDKDSSIGDHATMLRTETHKLIIAHGHDSGELYDLANDPHENRNLWNEAEHLGKKASLLKRLTDRMAWTTDPLPERRAVW